ncbi:MAG: ABC transporter permease [Clostridia bacterium]|nr:ABC transporter permease [Clostridia bacterium]
MRNLNSKAKESASPLLKNEGIKSVSASLLSIMAGLLVGGAITVIVALINDEISFKAGLEGLKLIFFGLFSTGRDISGNLTFGFNPVNIGNLLFRATPVIMTGLSVAVAFKTGLFNIGAPGQYLMGTAASLFIALTIPSSSVPTWIIWLLALIGGMAAGALWGAIPGALKAYLNINEVLACIMTNWIAANLVTWFFESSNLRNGNESGKIGYIMPTSANGVVTAKLGLDRIFPGSQVNGGILVAIIFAILVYVMIYKTTLGYSMKACGSNKHAAEYAGIKSKRMLVLSMAIAGALSGGGASLYYLSGNTEFFHATYQSLPAEGFNGIPIALLAANNPIGVIFSGLFMSMLNIAGQQLKNLTAYNEYITDIIIAAIVYLSAFSLVIKALLSGLHKRKSAVAVATRKGNSTTAGVQTHADEEIIEEINNGVKNAEIDFSEDKREGEE